MPGEQKIAYLMQEAPDPETVLAQLREAMARLDEYHAALHDTLDPLLARSAEIAASTQEDWRPLKACDAAGFSRETVRVWCERGVVRARKNGGRWFVDQQSLAAHLARIRGK